LAGRPRARARPSRPRRRARPSMPKLTRVRFSVRVMGWENRPIDAQAHPSSNYKLL